MRGRILKEEYPPQTDTGLSPQEYLAGLGISTVVFDNPDLRYGFAQVPNVVLRDRRLSPIAFKLYVILLSYAWDKRHCFPGQTRLADDTGCDARTVIRALKELQKLKLIRIEQRGQGKSNSYHIRRLTESYPKQMVDKGGVQ